MRYIKKHGILIAGICAGAVNGLLGAGGGMVLLPLLTAIAGLPEETVFPASVCMILPVCLVSLWVVYKPGVLPFSEALPWLLGSAAGGVLSGLFGKKIPVLWLHRFLGALILWGGIRNLC